MKNLTNILLTLFAVLLLGACASRPPHSDHQPPPPNLTKNQVWQLTLLNGRDIPNDSKVTTLSFNPEAGIFSAHSACNSFSGVFNMGETPTADGRRSFSLRILSPNTLHCPESDMNAEERFLSTLKKANYILADEHALSLFQNDKEILHFELQ